MKPLLTHAALEDQLSLPTAGVLDMLQSLQGDFMVLGAGGKMGPSLARMIRRGLDSLGQSERRVFAVSRFSSPAAAAELQQHGVQTIACDLLDRAAVQALPDVPNIIFMAGQKFGTQDAPELTWVMNTLVPAIVAERYPHSRIVVFSTACVYPLSSTAGTGSREEDLLDPPGDYANSCVGRERIFMHFSKKNGTAALLFRLSYAIDLRYGVLHDVAQKVAQGLPVDVTMGYANVIWQGDANARAIQCLNHTTQPPCALNVTGLERVSIRHLAEEFGRLFGRAPVIVGEEGATAWLFDASRSYEWFGPPTVTLEEMIAATAQWVSQGGQSLGKPTHFETRDGKF
ncbi:NAD-dependent epimerase/dehydratase family protein [Prosthecobacter dejongeii]|uniref:Nucleoside-diphosphate-sugar epimerase n=1 Tax=Prosthecobacter dejongeii TaxID=48465 RepID=A0A7W8DPN6_9BACT|nr:NAD-dependent epimerase/dehydratase family protein [Prosthecobacter dejongeii]MBB5037849.1 nucleoside-diphosphate-sugar epimerase [Prosthecobacter dejongeii]